MGYSVTQITNKCVIHREDFDKVLQCLKDIPQETWYWKDIHRAIQNVWFIEKAFDLMGFVIECDDVGNIICLDYDSEKWGCYEEIFPYFEDYIDEIDMEFVGEDGDRFKILDDSNQVITVEGVPVKKKHSKFIRDEIGKRSVSGLDTSARKNFVIDLSATLERYDEYNK